MACAKVCHLEPPSVHAVRRGICRYCTLCGYDDITTVRNRRAQNSYYTCVGGVFETLQYLGDNTRERPRGHEELDKKKSACRLLLPVLPMRTIGFCKESGVTPIIDLRASADSQRRRSARRPRGSTISSRETNRGTQKPGAGPPRDRLPLPALAFSYVHTTCSHPNLQL